MLDYKKYWAQRIQAILDATHATKKKDERSSLLVALCLDAYHQGEDDARRAVQRAIGIEE